MLGTIGLIASVASLVLAVLAIWLSIVFYRFAQAASADSARSANDIQSAVVRLEKLFDSLYADTFSMMRDTVGDMRKHIWHRPAGAENDTGAEASKSANAEILAAITEASAELGITQKQVAALVERVEPRVKESVDEVRLLPARVIRSRSQTVLRNAKRGITMNGLRRRISGSHHVPLTDFVEALFAMKQEGIVDWEGDELSGDSRIILTNAIDED